ncbi:MAG TPA: RNA 2',3'-cyclic phosphodiesterase [Solirubrobacteraceae bacterium]|nr:RNA 2',3'-cyclic phosphodiesterase [Solirubrobacteraceae bacterium]
MRLFVALALPALVRGALAAWAVEAAPAAMRRVPAENLHVTLAFLGSLAEEDAAAVARVLAEVARPVGALAVDGALWLPPRRPGVLSVALRGRPALGELHADLVAALAGTIGFEPERRALRPHVTVARARGRERVRPVALEPEPPPLEFEAEGLVLLRSHTGGPGGSRYEALARA